MSTLKRSILGASTGLALLASTMSYANINAAQGFYIGGDLTGTSYHTPSESSLDSSVSSYGTPVASYIRPYAGYRFNDYVAAEVAYDDVAADSEPVPNIFGAGHFRLYGADATAKLIYPMDNGFSVLGKAGLAYMHQSTYNVIGTNTMPNIDRTCNAILPVIGAGASYNFDQHFATNLNFTYILSNSTIGPISMLGLGLSYTF